MNLKIEISEKDLRELVRRHLEEKLGSLPLKPEGIRIEVKSKQNYRSEWEPAAFRATYEIETPSL